MSAIAGTNPLLSPYVVKITKMWRKLGAWFWLATQNIDVVSVVSGAGTEPVIEHLIGVF